MRILTFIMLALMAAGCSTRKSTSSKPDKTNFTGGKWEIRELAGLEIDPVKAGKEMPYIDFILTQKSMSAYAGCNRMNAGFILSADTIVISQMIATRMACPDMEYEYALERLLIPGKYTFKEDSNILFLYYNDSKVIEFVRPAPIQNK